jgi:light-regulated signal transduction histidine kinase (bacteriophytochrome)
VKITRHMNVPVFDMGRIVVVAGVANKDSDYDEDDINQLTLLIEGMWRIICRNRAENELLELNNQLEQRVAERTARMEAANKELEAFAYSVSHDLRTPLRSMDGFSQILLSEYKDNLDPTAQDYLMRIRGASQRMGQLIDDLLRLSRISRAELRVSQVNLSEIAQSIIEELREAQPERQVDFDVTPDMHAEADAALIRVVLVNLIHNAWKFTNQRERAHIEFGTFLKDGEKVYFVRDNGAGFEMTYVGKLFGVFQRLHNDRDFPGTGIGLATVQRIILRHGGRVWAEGAVDQGATFYFTLP